MPDAWSDEEIDAIAARIKRFGWPYKQYARGVVRVLLAEVDRLRPPALDPDDASVVREALWHAVQRGDIPDDDRRRAHVLYGRFGGEPGMPTRYPDEPNREETL